MYSNVKYQLVFRILVLHVKCWCVCVCFDRSSTINYPVPLLAELIYMNYAYDQSRYQSPSLIMLLIPAVAEVTRLDMTVRYSKGLRAFLWTGLI